MKYLKFVLLQKVSSRNVRQLQNFGLRKSSYRPTGQVSSLILDYFEASRIGKADTLLYFNERAAHYDVCRYYQHDLCKKIFFANRNNTESH
jgi:hypothetical protein